MNPSILKGHIYSLKKVRWPVTSCRMSQLGIILKTKVEKVIQKLKIACFEMEGYLIFFSNISTWLALVNETNQIIIVWFDWKMPRAWWKNTVCLHFILLTNANKRNSWNLWVGIKPFWCYTSLTFSYIRWIRINLRCDPITRWVIRLKHINTTICEPYCKLVRFLWMCSYNCWVDQSHPATIKSK